MKTSPYFCRLAGITLFRFLRFGLFLLCNYTGTSGPRTRD